MRKLILGLAAFAAIAITVPVAATVSSTGAEAQINVQVGGSGHHGRRHVRSHRRPNCRMVTTRVRDHGRIVVRNRRVCR